MLKILVVEDEELIRKGIILTVDWTALGCVVAGEASNGEEGLEAAERLHPELIITDLKMPKMDGLQMIKELRERGNNAAVIILTAYDSFAYAQQAIRLGAVDFLVKPFHDGELEAAVLALKEKNSGQKESALPEVTLPEYRKGVQSRYVGQAMEYIAKNYSDPGLSVGGIAEVLGISEGHLSHSFKKETDYTLLNYLTRVRIRRAMELLRDGKHRVYEVTELAGYRDITYFSSIFKKMTGMSPTEYQAAAGR